MKEDDLVLILRCIRHLLDKDMGSGANPYPLIQDIDERLGDLDEAE